MQVAVNQVNYLSMYLIEKVNSVLKEKKRDLTWLSLEMDRSYTGFKLSLEKETIKYSDLKKLCEVLNMPITAFFESGSGFQYISGSNNNQQVASTFNESPAEYRYENKALKDKVALLEQVINDKEQIIELLKQQKG